MSTPILGMDELVAAQSQPEVTVNAALRTLDAVVQLSVAAITNTPPGSPVEGDRYVCGTAPTGAWSGHADELAHYSGGWQFVIPTAGWLAYVVGDGLYLYDDSSSPPVWTSLGLGGGSNPYDIGTLITGVPTASAVALRYKVPRTVVFASGLSPSQGVAAVAATAQTDFDVRKNGSSVGTVRFAAAGTSATFIMASQTTFSAGDILTLVAPASPDATLADIGITLAGTRS